MNKAELGRRIKEARLAKKMTQSEVVGNFITRNMLSQIESGIASPSVKTLDYLSHVLEIPLDTLMADGSVGVPADQAAALEELKELYRSGKYEQAAEYDENSGVPSDELWAISAKSCLALAKRLSEENSEEAMRRAADHARRAAELAEKGIYSNNSVKTEALLLLNDLARRLSEYYGSMAMIGKG